MGRRLIPVEPPASKKIPASATPLADGNREPKLKLLFALATGNRYQLSGWQGAALDQLIKTFRLIEQLTAPELRLHDVLGFESIGVRTLAKSLRGDVPPEHEQVQSIRVNQTARLYGILVDGHFCALWFDRKHDICSGKQRA